MANGLTGDLLGCYRGIRVSVTFDNDPVHRQVSVSLPAFSHKLLHGASMRPSRCVDSSEVIPETTHINDYQ